MNDYKIGTKCVQAGYTPENGQPRQIPIIQSTTFKYSTSEDMGKLFDLEASGYFYTRLQNPTNDLVAAKIAEMEGGTAAMLTSSGQAANFFALFNVCECGSHIVASSAIYGGTFNLIEVTMRKMGITATFVAPDCTEEELNAAFKENTRAVFGETIANPALTVLDIEKFAKANKLTIIDVISQDSPYYNIGPSEFLFLERNAEVIITDSFHACVFAILNERPFVVVERKEKNFQSMGSRIDTLLDKFHLENRRYDAGSLDETAGTPINYTRVNEILEIERNDSIQYLKKYIGEN